jgi:oxalate decarboxylase/phosphoglucose isomerase-like protein (cupin superfamily)
MNQEEQIQTYGKDVIEALSSMVKWKYDDFHKVMLAEFSVDKQDQVLFTLQQVLPINWDVKTIKKAPNEVKHYAGIFSKLVKQQKLFSTNIERHPIVMVAWWPWGHGATVSVRLFLTDTSPYVAKNGFMHKLTRIFA